MHTPSLKQEGGGGGGGGRKQDLLLAAPRKVVLDLRAAHHLGPKLRELPLEPVAWSKDQPPSGLWPKIQS